MPEFLFDESELLRTMRHVVTHAAENQGELTDRLESTMCALWDATADRECAEYLCGKHLVASMIGALQRLRSVRAKEICWGVLGNAASHGATGEFEVSDALLCTLALEACDAMEIWQCLRFALATICSKLLPASYWVPCATKCLWCVENALRSPLVQTAADLLSAIYEESPQFYIVAPCAKRALELAQGDVEDDLAAQSLIRATETGMLADEVDVGIIRSLLGTMLALLESHACQQSTLELLEIVDAIVPHAQWPILECHIMQVLENDATDTQRELFGVAPVSGYFGVAPVSGEV